MGISIETRDDEIGILREQNQVNSTGYYFTLPDLVHNEQGFIHADSNQAEPLLYPLFFPFGEEGWGRNLKRSKISLLEYLKARFLQPEKGFYVKSIQNKRLHVNRFQAMSRLSQYYMVEGFSRSLDQQLEFQRKRQNFILGRADDHSDDSGHDEDGIKKRKKYFYLAQFTDLLDIENKKQPTHLLLALNLVLHIVSLR